MSVERVMRIWTGIRDVAVTGVQTCALPIFFTSHRSFIVFWERDITSEHHGTPVHIIITIYTLFYFLLLLSSCYHHYHYLLRLILCKQKGRRD